MSLADDLAAELGRLEELIRKPTVRIGVVASARPGHVTVRFADGGDEIPCDWLASFDAQVGWQLVGQQVLVHLVDGRPSKQPIIADRIVIGEKNA